MPFRYPDIPHVRRHGPTGYATYEHFRPWLRDEFAFRCVYCLKREQWGIIRRSFELDHFDPQSVKPDAAGNYDNLLYACAACNSAKRRLEIPNPCDCMLGGDVVVEEDGTITTTNSDAARIIRGLGLDAPEYCEFRKMYIGTIRLAKEHDPVLYRDLMRYPDDLPNLANLKPPGNSRPEGIEQSCFARKERGELPETY